MDFIEDDRRLIGADADAARAAGFSETAIEEAEARAAALAARDAIRGRIDQTAGDVPSLLGTTADTAAVALLGVLAAVAALDDGDSPDAWIAGFRARLDALGDDLPAQADAFLGAIAAGAIRVPALAKGFDRVVADIAARSTAVADAMSDHGD